LKRSFASRIFNTNPVWNFSLHPKEKLFLIFQSISLQFYVNFEAEKGWLFPFTNSDQFGKIETKLFAIGSGCQQCNPGEDSGSRHPSKHLPWPTGH
jgi:hypothetical protein